MSPRVPRLSRRDLLAAAGGIGVAAALPGFGLAAEPRPGPIQTRPIPVSGEQLPVVGSGSAVIYEYENDPAAYAERRQTLQAMLNGGGTVIDTAPAYGNAETNLGALIEDLGIRDQIFLATKVPAQNTREANDVSLRGSQERLKSQTFDLMQAWNVRDPNLDLAQLREWKAEGIARYWGITSFVRDADAVAAAIRREKPEFVQIDYSLSNRVAEEMLLPLARDNGVAVLTALPFGRASMFARVGGMPLPDWAAEIDATSWAQIFLKFLLAHPAVTVVIPGTDKPEYAIDNTNAGRGRIPDEAMRQRMIQWWDSLPA